MAITIIMMIIIIIIITFNWYNRSIAEKKKTCWIFFCFCFWWNSKFKFGHLIIVNFWWSFRFWFVDTLLLLLLLRYDYSSIDEKVDEIINNDDDDDHHWIEKQNKTKKWIKNSFWFCQFLFVFCSLPKLTSDECFFFFLIYYIDKM